MARTTKREAVTQIISNIEKYLSDQKIVTVQEIRRIRHENAITAPKIVACIERFCIPPFREGRLLDYLKAETEKGRLLIFKLHKHDQFRTRVAKTPISEQQLLWIAKAISNIIYILELKN